MDSETASSVDEQVGGGGGGASVGADTRGKHRILAELKRVEQELKFLEAYALIELYGKTEREIRGITGSLVAYFNMPCQYLYTIQSIIAAELCSNVWKSLDFGPSVIAQGYNCFEPGISNRVLKCDHRVGVEEELEELQKTDNVSTVCEELLRNVENIPDPLLTLLLVIVSDAHSIVSSITEQMALQTLCGIDGLRGPRIHKIAEDYEIQDKPLFAFSPNDILEGTLVQLTTAYA
ncbi:unnamed protein product [Dovyalis caffra]|uniref:Uncharacterized protein n=1 Tax=Dovyalis caffra TaxID=77055 RepID=A0AAV1S8S6_9ROSI|nr:unnamed protein product [Dovyalis caffra]